MNNNILDLHGMTEEQATGIVMSALFSFQESLEEEMEIITGRGDVLTRVVEDLVHDEGLHYFHRNGNYGSYIIKK